MLTQSLSLRGILLSGTGSTGDGYEFAETGQGDSAVPSLVPIETKEAYIPHLQGLSLRNVALTVKDGKKSLYGSSGR